MTEFFDDRPGLDDDVEEVQEDEIDDEEAARSFPSEGSDDSPASEMNH